MTLFLQALAGAIVWTFANFLYVDLKRKGVRSFARIVAFWMGMPVTWISLLVVREGRHPRLRPPPDDEDALLAEVRRDRALRIARERAAEAADREPRDAGRAVGEPGEANDTETT